MKIRRHSKKYNFIGDTITGTTFRWGKALDENPRFAPWPELADISISNHCSKGCEFCYRDSIPNSSFISIDEYEYLLGQLRHPRWGNVFQIALGGGEPLEHPDFLKIIDITGNQGVVPNFTTNGEYLTNEIITQLHNKIGAIAISTTDIESVSRQTIGNLFSGDIKCNIHYILNKLNVGQAIEILDGKYNGHLQELNSIIFLTYKCLGRGDNSRLLCLDDEFLKLINLIDKNKCSTRIGFDACFVPMLMHYTKVDLKYIDPCECAFFSVYIDEKLRVSPCSFASHDKFTYSLTEYTFEHIWRILFAEYRASLINNCDRTCKSKIECRGRCCYFDNVTLCYVHPKNIGALLK